MKYYPKISVIIPCYNADKFISQTLSSVINQDYPNFECIIINDGSKDNTRKIVEEIISNKDNFHLINQENKGLSFSRNVGINKSLGEYIYFLDADDLLADNTLSILSKCINPSIDIVIGKTATTHNHNTSITGYLSHDINLDEMFTNTNLNILEKVINNPISCIAPNKLYDKSFLIKNNLLFKNDLLHEDELWFFETLFHSKKVYFTNETTYFYNLNNSNSITNSRTKKNIIDYLYILNFIYKEYYLKANNKFEKEQIAKYIFTFKKNIIYCYSQTAKPLRSIMNKVIQNDFKKIQVERTKKFKKNDIEKYYYKFYVVSFINPEYILYYLDNINSKNFIKKIISKFLFRLSFFINKRTIKQFYKI